MDLFLQALTLGILLLPSLFLRYIPFRHFTTSRQNRMLAYCYSAWFIILFCIEFSWLQIHGISVELYKLTTMIGFLPYVFINIVLIPHHLAHHIFVLGMQCIYTLLVHTGAVLIIEVIGKDFSLSQLCYLQTAFYILIFFITLPFIRKFFDRVFLSPDAFNNQAYWRSACLLPLLIVADTIYLSYNGEILGPRMLIPRLILLPTFITLMYAFSYDVTGMEEKAQLATRNKFLSMQMSSLREHSKLLELSNKKMAIIRHDLRHYNRMLSTFVKEGNTDVALKFIKDCDGTIAQTKIEEYSLNPIINAALSIYISKAESENIPLTHNIYLPSEISIDDNELAILICNLLENALNASHKQPVSNRQINITVKNENNHIVLSVANRYQEKVTLGKDGLPNTTEQGHGIGMHSLTAFKEKYKATVLCDQQNGWFKIMIYVIDKK